MIRGAGSRWRQALGLFWLVLALLIAPQGAGAVEIFTMAFGGDPAQQPLYRFYERLYGEAFRRLGYQFAYQVYPSKRASVMANGGEVDGEPQRVRDYAVSYPNLIRVNEPSFTNRVLAFATNPDIRLDGWDSLRGTPSRLGSGRTGIAGQGAFSAAERGSYRHSNPEEAEIQAHRHLCGYGVGCAPRVAD